MSVLLFFIISVMISHLGINPVRGGKPPRDSRVMDVMGSIIGILFHRREIELIDGI